MQRRYKTRRTKQTRWTDNYNCLLNTICLLKVRAILFPCLHKPFTDRTYRAIIYLTKWPAVKYPFVLPTLRRLDIKTAGCFPLKFPLLVSFPFLGKSSARFLRLGTRQNNFSFPPLPPQPPLPSPLDRFFFCLKYRF